MRQKNHCHDAGFAVVEGMLILVIIAIIGFAGWFVVHAKHNANASLNNANNTAANTPVTKKATATAPSTELGAGTDNSSLNNDVNSINASQNQEAQSAATANTGLNDSSSQISVPTN